jgi:uroporphyrinogen decarboxylase
MLNRREFLIAGIGLATHSCSRWGRELTSKERVDRVLEGRELDRPPYTFYYHFGLEKLPGERHAQATLGFQQKFRTDLVKVMSDFPFPRSQGDWHAVEVIENPYPEQIRALQIIRDGLKGKKYFIETVFNPWNVATKLCSEQEVLRMKEEDPELLLDTLDKITESQANHAKRAIEAGAAGIFLAIANAQGEILSGQEYERFSEPFDRRVLEAVSSAPLNTLHLHGEGAYLERFYSDWPAAIIQYSVHGTGVPFSQVRQSYEGVLMGGIDERSFRDLSQEEMRSQWRSAQQEAGTKLILAPGCSVPNDTTDEELMRLVDLLQT